MRNLLDAWDDVRLEVEGFSELDEARVLVLARFSGVAKASGIELGKIRPPAALLFELVEGKPARVVYYTYRDHAFAELGVSAEDIG
jgi:hypothetical protein